MHLSADQEKLHQEAINLCRQYRMVEWKIVQILQQIEQTKLYRKLEMASLFQYAVKCLNLPEPTAYTFITVVRKAAALPQLQTALMKQKLSISKAARIASVLSEENSTELISFAAKNPIRAIDFEVAKRNPKAATRESAKPLSKDYVELKLTVSKETLEQLERIKALLKAESTFAKAIEVAVTEYVRRHDPLQKAARAMARKGKRGDVEKIRPQQQGVVNKSQRSNPDTHQLCKTELEKMAFHPRRRLSQWRIPLREEEKHQVTARDGGQCTFKDHQGQRCENNRYLQIHHIRPVSAGGDNSPDNLTTLCSAHHDLVHQLSFALEGQVTWLREPGIRYG